MNLMSSGRSIAPNTRSTFSPNQLHVVMAFANHLRYESRQKLFIEAVEHILNSGVTLYVVELAHGDRRHVLQFPSEVTHIKLRTTDILWQKENQLNIGMQAAIDNGAQYLAWVDGDITFMNTHWATETIEALQTFSVIQPWKYSLDLDHRRNVVVDENGKFLNEGFCSVWAQQLQKGDGYISLLKKAETLSDNNVDLSGYDYGSKDDTSWPLTGHPGYAWAIRTDVYQSIGGLIDWSILGQADYLMALGFAGLLDRLAPRMLTSFVLPYALTFQALCDRYVKYNIGFLDGTIHHGWHGPKAKRGYLTRHRITNDSQFDPALDLVKDQNGLYRFARNNFLLRDGIRQYFLSREEDQLAE